MYVKRFILFTLAAVFITIPEARAEPETNFVAESAVYPIRIFYDEAEDEDLVWEKMSSAEAAWQAVVENLGLTPPLCMVGDQIEEGFDLWLDPEAPGGLYSILGDNPATPKTDCPTIAIFNAGVMMTLDQSTLYHFITRNSLHAVDCIEPSMPAYDMFASAFGIIGETGFYVWTSALAAFQGVPWMSVDSYGNDSYFKYGSALFALFIDEAYGSGDGSLLIDIWNRTSQDGTIETWDLTECTADVENEPDFLDAIEMELDEQGVSFEEAFIKFVEWRYFVGADDDGAHFSHGNEWVTGQVARDATLTATDLPLMDAQCVNRVAEYGSNYIELDPDGLELSQDLTFTFSGNTNTRWSVSLFLIPTQGPATVQIIPLTDDYSGEYQLAEASSYHRVVMAVANLSDGEHDPDDMDWSDGQGDFTYSITGPPVSDDDDAGPDAATTDAGSKSGSSGGCGCRIAAAPSEGQSLVRLFIASVFP